MDMGSSGLFSHVTFYLAHAVTSEVYASKKNGQMNGCVLLRKNGIFFFFLHPDARSCPNS